MPLDWRANFRGIYGLTAEAHSRGRSNIDVVRQMIAGGIKTIQYREKDKPLGQQYAECLAIRQLTRDAGVTLIINDYIELARLVDADGVHIGQDDLPIEAVRQLLGPGKIIGLSTHSLEQASDAMARGADYIGVGPIYATQTKKDVCAPVGLAYLDDAVRHVTIPFVAIGGIKEHNIAEVAGRGASSIAMVTEIVGADDITAQVYRLRQKAFPVA
ncbi:thiamine phosphate synthase [Heliophilum fasciatum]|uniref:Thiamine-phosphate synthase n=1 Tax=Heliophilum fasciatum TaxID=35700 RepID=A0A4R2RMH0_9FIRM|nr:thiamine phosphate synthase [Heliophilum fasciatum]MCW2277529.1 thiamine-phosphate pyrophosphorylase [Heliophilum fasciatum]TCP65180.1 thiamine-phosphate diphosphorylase [Heliophilum fasciatum]